MRIPGGKPSVLEKVPERMQAVQAGDTFNIHVSLNYIESNARRAFLRIGYLALFDFLGTSCEAARSAIGISFAGSSSSISHAIISCEIFFNSAASSWQSSPTSA